MNNNKLKKIMLLIAVIALSIISCNKNPSVKNIETDEVLISVSYADESFFEKYKTYEQYNINNEYSHKIAFIPNVPVKDFSWLSVGFKYDDDWDFVRDDDGGFVFVVEEELYRLEELLPQKPLVVSWVEVGMMSVFGYSYRDTDGQKKYFVGMVRNYGGDEEEEEEAEGGNAPKESASPYIIWQFFPETPEPDFNQMQKLIYPVTFNNKTIPMTVYYTRVRDGEYLMHLLDFEYDGKNHSINLDGLENNTFYDPDYFDKIYVDDYNFDNYMDISFLSLRGAYHSFYQIYIYNPQEQKFYHHADLDYMPDILRDEKTQTIKSHGKSGHAGLLYTDNELKWENGQFTPIYRAIQSYDEDLDLYILTTETLENGVWKKQTQTFKAEDFQD